MYARRPEPTVPDWYQRRVDTIRSGDTKERMWPWELTSRPTEKQVYGYSRQSPRPWQRGYQAVLHDIEGQVRMPRHGDLLDFGCSPRAGLALINSARARAIPYVLCVRTKGQNFSKHQLFCKL